MRYRYKKKYRSGWLMQHGCVAESSGMSFLQYSCAAFIILHLSKIIGYVYRYVFIIIFSEILQYKLSETQLVCTFQLEPITNIWRLWFLWHSNQQWAAIKSSKVETPKTCEIEEIFSMIVLDFPVINEHSFNAKQQQF